MDKLMKILQNPVFRKGVENIAKQGAKALSALWRGCGGSK